MEHYDECRDVYCGRCGQSWGNCEHTKDRPDPFLSKEVKINVTVKNDIIPPDKISIGRYYARDRSQGIQVTIEDNSGTIIYNGHMTLENFAKAITGHAMMPIQKEEE